MTKLSNSLSFLTHKKATTGQLVYRETFLAALMKLKSSQPTPSDDADSIFPPPVKFKMLMSPLDGLGAESGLGRGQGRASGTPTVRLSMARSWGIPGPSKNYNRYTSFILNSLRGEQLSFKASDKCTHTRDTG